MKNGAGTSIAGSLALSSDAKTATFKPSSSLGFSTSYTATITTGVKDKAGNAMTGAKNWSFTTVGQSHLLVVTRMLQYLLLRLTVLNQETLHQRLLIII